jgi:capsular exopolysaccharide synthesis family protein
MSRVYEPLRKVERQRAAEEQRKTEMAALAKAVRQFPASRLQPQLETATAGRSRPQPTPAASESAERRVEPLPLERSQPESEQAALGSEECRQASERSVDASGGSEVSLRARALFVSHRSRGPLLVVGHEQQHQAAAEQFHLLSLSVQSWATENEKRLFMTTSALSGEGKSFVALNLAASLAMSDNRVILVDADLRQPVLHHSFNVVPMHGLIGYLKGDVEFGACLQETPIPGLLLVPAGGTSYAPAEVLASRRMRDFVREARSIMPLHYVIIDSPAASLVPEPQILARLADALVIVVAANRTPRALVRRIIEAATSQTIFGIVMNRFDPPHSSVVNYPAGYTR